MKFICRIFYFIITHGQSPLSISSFHCHTVLGKISCRAGVERHCDTGSSVLYRELCSLGVFSRDLLCVVKNRSGQLIDDFVIQIRIYDHGCLDRDRLDGLRLSGIGIRRNHQRCIVRADIHDLVPEFPFDRNQENAVGRRQLGDGRCGRARDDERRIDLAVLEGLFNTSPV